MSAVLVLAAHPDDAELSAGGTIASFVSAGRDVVVATLTTSETTADGARRRRACAARAATILGHRLVWFEDGVHDQVEDVPEYKLVRYIDALVDELRPRVVLAPWTGDSHADHARLARAALSSSRRGRFDLYAYAPGEHRTTAFTSFTPSLFVDVTGLEGKKLEAVGCYRYEGQAFRPLDDQAVTSALRFFGAAIGVASAEAFIVVRQLGFPAS